MPRTGISDTLFDTTIANSDTGTTSAWEAPYPGQTSPTFFVATDEALTANVEVRDPDGTWHTLTGATAIAITADDPVSTIEVAHSINAARLTLANASGSTATVLVWSSTK